MSNIFYRFLSERIIDYFYKNHPTSGEKYHILVEKEDQVKKLYRELKTNTLSHRFSYRDAERDQEYDTYELNFGEIGLLVAASMEGGPHPDFLATLRNMVGVEKEYKNKAILFIHSSSSDSILGGSGSLSKEGMPLNIAEIEKYINQKINTNGYSELDQKILKQYMKNKKRELEGMTASFFEYEDVVECLSNSQIAANQYRKFGLFPDKRLTELTGKKLEESLEENHKNYVKVAGVHSYGDDYSSLETWYGENGEKALSKENWEDISFSEVEKYISSRKNKSSIEYCPMLSTTKIWDKEEGDTKAKGRIRNILVFLDENEEEKEFLLEFSEYTNKKCISVSGDYNRYLTVTTSGKKLKVQLHNVEDSVVFFRFKYTAEGKKFDFKIAVLRCAPEFLENIKSCYSIEMTGKKTEFYAIRIRTDEDKVILNKDYEKQREVVICENRQPVAAEKDEKLIICIGEDYPYSEDSDDIYFSVGVGGTVIPMLKTFVTDAKTSIKGLKLWYLKHSRQCDFEIRGDNSLLLGTKPYYTQDEFRKSLDLEKSYIDTGSPFVIEELENSPELKAKDIILPDSVRKSFDAIISYFRESGKLPSLSYINPQLKVLYENYIQSVIAVIDAVPEGTYLKKDIKGLFYLGMVKREYGDREILLSPLHPVNIAYQLFIQNTDIRGIEEEQYTLLRKYQQTSLLPYINFNPATEEPCIYSPVEQMDSPEWKIYVEESLPRYKTSKDFVSKLVFEKIKEFTTHFSYLFGTKTAAPIRINLINTGDCREIVQGILKYYAHELKDTNGKHLIPVQVTMYYSYKMDTVFELMSRIEDPDELRKMLGFSEKAGNADFNDIIEAYRNNVHFYSRILDGELGYAHITFMEMDDEHQAVNTLMRDIPSGVVMNGISSGVPAERLGDSYRTGFGVKYANTQSQLMNISMKYNALNAAMNGETYRSDSCYALKIGHNRERLLDRIYDSSNWVTFINPKVDLSYFKSDSGSRDLMIIHYSDQYNMTSSGYDAITVTRKSGQYQEVISRYLSSNGVESADRYSRRIINIFNALNGDWLLRMLSYKSHFPMEKISILSAMKLAIKRYSSGNVIWVPVSLEEIFRVSGSVGLPQSESDFSPKNLGFEGQTSDDLLLIGILNEEKVKVSFYPVEVKTGRVEEDYLEKGIRQVTKTCDILKKILGTGSCLDKDIKTRLYRNFFMQQAVVSAEKMLMYEVGEKDFKWKDITESDLRRKLLNEEYEIVPSLIPEMGTAGVISFRNDCIRPREFRRSSQESNILIVEETGKQGINLLIKEFKDIPSAEWTNIKDFSEQEINDFPEELSQKTVMEQQENILLSENMQPVVQEDDRESALIKKEPEVSAHPVRILIGEDPYKNKVYWEFGNKALANRHLLITGTSGQGKTYCIQTLLYELNKRNISAVIFDYTEGFTPQQLEPFFKEQLKDELEEKNVYRIGVPVNPFRRQMVEMAGEAILEKEADVAARLADIFVHVYSFGDQQYSAIFDAAYNGLVKYGDRMNMNLFQDELELVADKNKSARSVISKMSPFFHTVEFNSGSAFDWGKILYAEKAKINIIQLSMFTEEIKVIITEMMLWDMWYYTKKVGTKDKPFVVVLDEAQNLSHSVKSPTKAILTEGRKFGWSGWFATQSLGVLKNDEIVRLLQAAFKLYFKPADNEIIKTARQLDVTGEKDWLSEVQNLKKGQCIAVGDKMKSNGKVGPAAPTITSVTSFEKRKP